MTTSKPLKLRALLTYENNPEDLLLRMCVREAFLKLQRSWLVGLASHLQVQLPSGAPLLDVICTLATSILGADDGAALQVVARRLASMDRMEMFGDELEQLDEAVELLDKNDRAKAKESKREHERLKQEQKELREGYKEKAKVVRAAQALAAPAEAKRKVWTSATSQRIRVPPFPSHSVSIQEARRYLPPDVALWIGVGEGNLQGHLKPSTAEAALGVSGGRGLAGVPPLFMVKACPTHRPRGRGVTGLWVVRRGWSWRPGQRRLILAHDHLDI